MKRSKLLFAAGLLLVMSMGCVYYNTFYLAKKNFREAENERNKTGKDQASGSATAKYNSAVQWSSRILTEHPQSKYVDDALYVIGKSYYHTGGYAKAERKFRELLATFPKSKYRDEALFYLGKCYLNQEEYVPARKAFIDVDSLAKSKHWRGEAQYMLGDIEFEEERYPEAIGFYERYLDEFSGGDNAAEVQLKIGDACFQLEQYDSAKNAYLGVDRYSPDDSLYYEASFRAGETYYKLRQIDSGYAIFEKLSKNQKYYKKSGDIRLKLAEAETQRGDYPKALEEYRKITVEFSHTDPAAVAFYEMGEIYLTHMDVMDTAKTFYDSSLAASRNSPVKQQATERSADIAKLGQYRSQISGKDLDMAAKSQYELAELYLFDLNNPDTALVEFGVVVDSFPDSRYAPRAMMAEAYIRKQYLKQPEDAANAFRKLLERYPHCDYVPQAAQELGYNLDSLALDYPAKRFKLAEDLYLNEQNVDSAIKVLQSIQTEFPASEYAAKAAFSQAWLTEKYLSPERYEPGDSTFVPDSSVVFAYQGVVEKFEGTPYSDAALQKLGKHRPPKPKKAAPTEETSADSALAAIDTAQPVVEDTIYEQTSSDSLTSLLNSLMKVKDNWVKKRGEFVYPPSAYSGQWEGYVSFMVKIDGLGKPTEWRILNGAPNKDIDAAAIESLKFTEYDVGEIDLALIDQWVYDRIRVELPPEIKGRQ